MMKLEKYIDEDILEKYEFYNYGHAFEILHDAWDMWGNQAVADYEPNWNTYANHTIAQAK